MRQSRPAQIRKDVGRKVSEIRRKQGLTQEAFAVLVEVSTPYIARVEGGRENLTLDSLTKFANVLHVQVLDLFRAPRSRRVLLGRPPKQR